MTQSPQQGLVAFRPRARLLKLIGSELISDDVLAIMELVKNAHDADASEAVISFHGTSRPDGEIVVRDDGSGMDLDTLLGLWMQPASTSKNNSSGRRTARGRRVLGEKGVGRFATDKLARRLELVSRRNGESRELRATFDWDAFDSDEQMLSEVKSRWDLRPATMEQTTGTILRMTGLRTAWNERMFRRLSTRLCRLLSPFHQLDNFGIRIESDEFPQYSGEIRPEFVNRSPYQLEAHFDGEQAVEVILNGAKTVKHLWNGQGDLRCGPVGIRIYGFDLESNAVAKIGPPIEVRAWLREWSGISIYRDGFRTWPYGEPHDDWLRLDQRRVNNPVERFSNNQVVGFVEITRDGNPDLTDQTNREGLLHNRALEDLRRLLFFVLQLLEAERQTLRHPTPRSSPYPSAPGKGERSIADAIDRLARKADPDLSRELTGLSARAREETDRERARIARTLGSYAELAALGQAATGLSRSLRPHLDQVREDCARIRDVLQPRGRSAVLPALRSLELALALMAERIAMLTPMGSTTNHRRRALDVQTEFQAFEEMVRPLLDLAGAGIKTKVAGGSVLRIEMRPEAFHRLLYILTTNSLDWLKGSRDPQIRVAAEATGEHCEITFSDNGPGIPVGLGDRVFDPGFSARENGRGLGLAIARSMVELNGGQIAVVMDGRRQGACLKILLPRKRSRSTVHR